MTAWLVVLVPLALLWNLLLISGMLAGKTTNAWWRRGLMVLEFVLFFAAFFIMVAFVPLAARAETKSEVKVALFLAVGSGVVAGTLMTFVEYVLAGQRRDFLADLGRMVWFAR